MIEEFVNPLDSMPIATNGSNRYAPPEKLAELNSMSMENPRPEEEIADDWFEETPEIKEETPHHIVYEIATAKYNPFAVGGSETLGGS